MLVKKANGKWRIYIDYIDLNKAYPKDIYPLPIIDQLLDATSRHELLNFIDPFSRYNQIKIAKEDEEKINFIIERGFYYYKMIPFGLKNVVASYQYLVNKVFKTRSKDT